MMVNCVVIDDLKNSIDLIANHMKNKPELTLVASFTNPLNALQFLEQNKIDLVFIDMEMPYLNGLEFIETLRSKKGDNIPKFIFTTGHVEHALSCFEQGVRDYLVKPIGFKRFSMAVDRVINDQTIIPPALITNKQFFFADVSGTKIKINFRDISYVESLSNYIKIVCDKEKYVLHKSMNSLGDILPSTDFIRIHKSYIVSISHIVNYKGTEIIVTVDDSTTAIPIGGKFKDNLNKKLGL